MTDWSEKLVTKLALNEHSAAMYVAGLKYWSAWHELRYGCPFPLSGAPPVPVSGPVLIDFLSDHMIKASQGNLTLCMAEPLKSELAKQGFNRKRTLVVPRTTEWRINVLKSIQKACNLPFGESLVTEHLPQLQASFRASKAAIGDTTHMAASLEHLINRLLMGCASNDEGYRDAALIVLLSYLSPLQAAHLRMGDLLPGLLVTNEGEIDAIDITLHVPETKRQRLAPLIRLLRREAIAVKTWGEIRERQSAPPDAPFFTRQTRVDRPVWLNEVWITRRLRLLVEQAGLLGTGYGPMCTPKKLRMAREHEHFEQSIQARLGRAMRIGISAALRMAERAREPCS